MNNINADPLGTPIYIADGSEDWPKDKFFYLLSKDGFMVGRNHPFFESLAKAPGGPGDLPNREPFIRLNYPLIPQHLLEKAVGFFAHIHDANQWESAVVFAYNRNTKEVEMIIPDQKANMSDVKYEIPNLPHHYALIGDMHSHGNWSADPSFTDEKDEENRPGLHLIVGHINKEPPTFVCVAVADGQRFKVDDPYSVMEGYEQRNGDVPEEWIAKVKHKAYSYSGGGNDYWHPTKEQEAKDDKIIEEVKDSFRAKKHMPDLVEVRTEMFQRTKHASYLQCEDKAKAFLTQLKKERGCEKAAA